MRYTRHLPSAFLANLHCQLVSRKPQTKSLHNFHITFLFVVTFFIFTEFLITWCDVAVSQCKTVISYRTEHINLNFNVVECRGPPIFRCTVNKADNLFIFFV